MSDQQQPSPVSTAPAEFPIVGIGASAGGLEAFSEFLEHLAPDLGMGYVLVQHLDPNHRSILASLLASKTQMPVSEAADGVRVEPNHVYVIPPNTNLAILHGVLHLMPPAETRAPQLTVDYFLRSLAQDQGERAIGVILSGTASDGVTGIKMIKAEGGITFAQDAQTARYSGMPHAAIASGCIDFVLSPAAIAHELRHVFVRGLLRMVEPIVPPSEEEQLNKIFIMLRRRTGVDFTHYKPTTIHRRIRRRMLVHRLERLGDYARLLHDRPVEVEQLYNEILINVTAFFRDPEVFDALAREVFPKIVPESGRSEPVRVWVPGCSTGEEPYSLAIVLLEYMEKAGIHVPVQVFATDIDMHAIEAARAGLYPESIAADITPPRLSRYFTRAENGYQISKQIRDMCLFAKQNVVKDPPFSRLDLISCRNLLIYLGPVLQKKVLGLLHYALKPSGFMMLGVAETIGKYADMFRTVDAKNKIYVKKAIATTQHFEFSAPQSAHADVALPPGKEGAVQPLAGRELSKVVDRMLMKKYCPASVVVNEQLDIVQFRGETGPFLEHAPGEASFGLVRMALDGLAMELREVVTQAIKTQSVVRKEGIHFRHADEVQRVEIEVSPVQEFAGNGFYLVVFRATPLPQGAASGTALPSAEQEARVSRLEQELTATKEYLQSVIEQDETINEELRSANEEILSSNEELQSTNEELETAKEELQSVNEELSTVNEELETRNRELTLLNNDLSNLLSSIDIPIVILGADLRIRRITPLAEKQLNLIAADVGRSITDIRLRVDIPDLRQVLERAIETVSIEEVEGQGEDGRWYSIRVRPHRALDNKIEGAIVAFIDVDEIKRGLKLAQAARDYAQSIVNAIRRSMLVLDRNLRVLSANPAYLDTFRVTMKDTAGNLLYHLGNGQWGIPRLREALEDVCLRGEGFADFVVEHDFEAIGRQRVCIAGSPVQTPSGEPPFLALMQVDGLAVAQAGAQ